MNCSTYVFKGLTILLFCVVVIGSCRKKNSDPVPPGNPGNPANATVDFVSNRLQFLKSSKKQGIIPKGPTGSLLKISFKDTLFLFDEIKRSIKFLHMDTTKNVSGVYLQVQASSNGGTASHYYDIPEVADVADSDTVSVILIGVDPAGLPLPQTFDVRIVPYDKNKQPIAEAIKPIKIDRPKKELPGNAGTCGISLPTNEFWAWELSVSSGSGQPFYNDPFVIHSAGGQDIEGSCCSGKSSWPLFCVGEIKHNKRLHFGTYYQIKQETFTFYSAGSFFRLTLEDSPVPVPNESDFCGSGAGKVLPGEKLTTYDGDWKIVPVKLPANPPVWLNKDSLELILLGKSSTGTGYGNPGGVIHQLDCELGSLVLVQIDKEGGGRHLVKVYGRRKIGGSPWYNFN